VNALFGRLTSLIQPEPEPIDRVNRGDRVIMLEVRHLHHLLSTCVERYNHERRHPGLDLQTPDGDLLVKRLIGESDLGRTPRPARGLNRQHHPQYAPNAYEVTVGSVTLLPPAAIQVWSVLHLRVGAEHDLAM
jgi:hypothetical protein